MTFRQLLQFRGMVKNSNMARFKAVAAASALIAVSGIGYYFVVYLPARDKAALVEKRSAERAAAEQQAKIIDCVHSAEIEYTATWNSNCASQAKKNRDHYTNCIAQGLGKAFCHDYYGEQSTVNCGLPRTVAQAINDNLQRKRELCYQQSR